jgi:hypothetical protein
MGLLDRFRDGAGMQRSPAAPGAASTDAQAIERYRYMLRTAPPETIEQAHAEAFARLTPEQRQRVLSELREATPAGDGGALATPSDSPGELARLATRAEIREPGVLERMFGGLRSGPAMAPSSMGSLFGTTLLSSMAGTVLGSMVAQHFFNSHPDALQRFGEWPHAADDLGQSSADGDQVSDDASPHDSDPSGGVDDGGIDFGGTFDV